MIHKRVQCIPQSRARNVAFVSIVNSCSTTVNIMHLLNILDSIVIYLKMCKRQTNSVRTYTDMHILQQQT